MADQPTDERTAQFDADLKIAHDVIDPILRGDQPELVTTDAERLWVAYEAADRVIYALASELDGLSPEVLVDHIHCERLSKARRYVIAALDALMQHPKYADDPMSKASMLDVLKTHDCGRARMSQRLSRALVPSKEPAAV